MRLLLLLASICVVFQVHSGDSVQIELEELAKQVHDSIRDVKTVRIGRFTGQGDVSSSFGTEIQRVLQLELSRIGVSTSKTAPVEVNGEYRAAIIDPDQPNLEEMYVRVNTKVVDSKTGDPLNTIKINARAIYGNESLARILSVPVSIPPSADRKQENAEIRKRIERPTFSLSGSRIRSKEDSPFAVEILIVDNKNDEDPVSGAAVTKTADGLPYVRITRGQFYRLKIHNNAEFDAAVKISIDGVDQFSFSDKEFCDNKGSPKFNYRIIPKGTGGVINGWFRNLKSVDNFVVTEFAKSAASELNKDPMEAGQICVQIFACWTDEFQKPNDEGSRTANDATGRSPGGKQDLETITRNIGGQREVIGFRYGQQ